jgi:hypothetical protein
MYSCTAKPLIPIASPSAKPIRPGPIGSDLEAIYARLALLPTYKELAKLALLIAFVSAVQDRCWLGNFSPDRAPPSWNPRRRGRQLTKVARRIWQRVCSRLLGLLQRCSFDVEDETTPRKANARTRAAV